jgi:hypothetical protein
VFVEPNKFGFIYQGLVNKLELAAGVENEANTIPGNRYFFQKSSLKYMSYCL